MNTELTAYSEPLIGSPQDSRDLIKSYVQYADIFESPPEAHEAVATTLISAAVNGNVWIDNGGQHLTLDCWTLLLSGSGVGRNTLVSLLWKLLDTCDLQHLITNTTWGSKQAFYQDLAENPHRFFVWEEMSVVLDALSDARLGEAKKWLTDIYDSDRIPQTIKYRVTGKDTATPSIVFTAAPRTSILASSSAEWFASSLDAEDSMGGFIPRWLIVQAAD